MLKELIALADKLDKAGLRKEADEVDLLVKKFADAPPGAAAPGGGVAPATGGGDLAWEANASRVLSHLRKMMESIQTLARDLPNAKAKNIPPNAAALELIAKSFGAALWILKDEYPDMGILGKLAQQYRSIDIKE